MDCLTLEEFQGTVEIESTLLRCHDIVQMLSVSAGFTLNMAALVDKDPKDEFNPIMPKAPCNIHIVENSTFIYLHKPDTLEGER